MSARSRAPAHQNSTAFKHNPNSRLTDKIARIPNEGLCQRCHDIIEWRKRYRKYKPLTAPRKCNRCQQKSVKFAYHHLCKPCSQKDKVCPKCVQSKELIASAPLPLTDESLLASMVDTGIRERRRRLVIRAWQSGEKDDEEIKAMIRRYTEEAMEREGDDEDDDEFGDEEDDDSGEEGKEDERRTSADAENKSKSSTSAPPSTVTAPRSTAPSTVSSSSSTSSPTTRAQPLKPAAGQKSGQGGGTRSSPGRDDDDDDDDLDDD